MQEFSSNVTGFDELFKKMDDLADEIGRGKTDKIWRKAMAESMRCVLDDAKSFAPQSSPKSTGQLREHIYLKVQKPQARDKASQSYQGEMYMARVTVSPKREDVKYRMVLNKRGRFQTVAYNMKPVAVSQEFGNKRLQNSEFGTAAMGAHPFMRPALENNYDRVIRNLGENIWHELFMGKYAKKE